MIGVSQRALGEIPGLVPTELRFVEQDVHQFGNRERGVSVVELNGGVIRQAGPVIALRDTEAIDDILQRATDHEVLLEEAQSPAGLGGVVGIEHPSERFCFLSRAGHPASLDNWIEVDDAL
jgi:hypothetical protein